MIYPGKIIQGDQEQPFVVRETAVGDSVASISDTKLTADQSVIGASDYTDATVSVDGESREVTVVRPRLRGALPAASETYASAVEQWESVSEHHGVQSVVDWGIDEDGPVVVVNRVSGDSLGTVHSVSGDETGEATEAHTDVDPDRVMEIAAECAETLQGLHVRGVTHRAITPDRVLLGEDGPLLTDVGTGAVLAEAAAGFSSLSPAYTPPEQFEPSTYGEPGRRTDVYRLGAVVYELLTGQPPYDESGAALIDAVTDPDRTPDPPSEHTDLAGTHDGPEAVDELIQTALAVDPADRYATAGAFAAALSGESASDWGQFGATPARRGSLPSTGPSLPSIGSTTSLEQSWGVDTGYNEVAATPVIADGTAYVGGNDDVLYAVRTDTGNEEWTVEFDSPVDSAAAVVDDTVLVHSGETLFALARADGEELWNTDVGRVHGPPAVADGTVYLGNDDGVVIAIDADTGERDWTLEAGGYVRGGPAVAAGAVFVGDSDGTVYAVERDSGETRWESESFDRGIETTPAVGFGSVYVVCGGDVTALEVGDGTAQWTYEGDAEFTSPAVAGGRVLVGSEYDGLTAIDTETGEHEYTVSEHDTVTAPAVSNGVAIACTGTGVVRGVSVADGTEAWSVDFDEELTTAPALTRDGLVVGGDDGSVLAALSEESAAGGAAFGVCGGDVSHPPVDSLQSPETEWGTANGTPARTRHVRGGPPAEHAVEAERDGSLGVGAPESAVATRWTFTPEESVESLTRTSSGRHYLAAVHDRELYAVESDGTLAWSADVRSRTGVGIVADGERVYTAGDAADSQETRRVSSDADELVALNAETGDLAWSRDGVGEVQTPTVVGGLVYTTDEGGLSALDAETGTEAWSTSVEAEHPPTVGHGGVYVLGGGSLSMFDAGVGIEQWTVDAPFDAVGEPALADERLYIGTADGSVVAVDAETGTEAWTTTVDWSIRTNVAATSDTVYVAGDDGKLAALDAETGSVEWTASSDEPVNHPLAVTETVVCVPAREGVLVLDADTGVEQWHYREHETGHPSGVVVGSGTASVVSEGTLRMLEPRTSQPATTAALGGETSDRPWGTHRGDSQRRGTIASPTVAETEPRAGPERDTEGLSREWTVETGDVAPAAAYGTLFASTGSGGVSAYDPATGDERWEMSIADEGVASGITVASGRVFFGTYPDGLLYALDATTGETLWTYEIDGRSSERSVDTQPTVAHGTVYVGGGGNVRRFHAVDAATGEEQFVSQYERDVRQPAVVSNGWAYVSDDDGTFHAVNPVTGIDEWTFDSVRGKFEAAAAADSQITLVDEAGHLYALDAQSGRPLWENSDVYTGPPVVASGTVYVPREDAVVGYDTASGQEALTVDIDSRVETLAVAGETVYAGGDRGLLAAVDTEDGRVRWSTRAVEVDSSSAEASLSSLVLAYGAVFAVGGTYEKELIALTADSDTISARGSLDEVQL